MAKIIYVGKTGKGLSGAVAASWGVSMTIMACTHGYAMGTMLTINEKKLKKNGKVKRFVQYPRGENKGGVLKTRICPTISKSSWESNCILLEMQEDAGVGKR